MKELVNRIDYKDKEGHYDILDVPVPVEVLKFVDKYFRFNYTNAKSYTNFDITFRGMKDFGCEPYLVILTVSIDEVNGDDMYPYDLTVSQGYVNCIHETGYISSQGRFARTVHGNSYV